MSLPSRKSLVNKSVTKGATLSRNVGDSHIFATPWSTEFHRSYMGVFVDAGAGAPWKFMKLRLRRWQYLPHVPSRGGAADRNPVGLLVLSVGRTTNAGRHCGTSALRP